MYIQNAQRHDLGGLSHPHLCLFPEKKNITSLFLLDQSRISIFSSMVVLFSINLSPFSFLVPRPLLPPVPPHIPSFADDLPSFVQHPMMHRPRCSCFFAHIRTYVHGIEDTQLISSLSKTFVPWLFPVPRLKRRATIPSHHQSSTLALIKGGDEISLFSICSLPCLSLFRKKRNQKEIKGGKKRDFDLIKEYSIISWKEKNKKNLPCHIEAHTEQANPSRFGKGDGGKVTKGRAKKMENTIKYYCRKRHSLTLSLTNLTRLLSPSLAEKREKGIKKDEKGRDA